MRDESLWTMIWTLCFLAAFAGAAGAQTAEDGEEMLTPAFSGEGPWVVRVHVTERAEIDKIASWADLWMVEPEAGYIVVLVDAAGHDRLLAEGFRVTLDERQTASLSRLGKRLLHQRAGIPGFSCYRTVEETYATADAIVAAHPGLASLIDIGDSWEKTQNAANGFDLRVLRLTQSAVPGPKPALFANCAIHAREYTTAELCTRFAEHLVAGYGSDPDITWILDHHEIHLNLIANPDGRKQAETGLSWRKNTNNDYCGGTNSRGADLNRNFPFQWNCCGGSSTNECSETFNGAGPTSEPEVQAIRSHLLSLFPDQRDPDLASPAPDDATGVMLDVHSAGGDVLWSWGFTTTDPPNDDQIWTLGRKYAFFTDYRPQSGSLSTVDGATKDFAYGELGVPGFTIELGTQFFEACSLFEGTIVPDNLQALLYTAKVVRTPYQTPAGPETVSPAVPLVPFAAGDLVQLTATVDDTRYSANNGTEPTQNIAGAEVFVDLPPWDAGAAGQAMSASDGTFDEQIEAVEATLDTTGLAAGRHTLFVRGADVAGNDGAVSAAFLYVVDPVTSPVIEGTVRDAVTLAPLAATVTLGPFTTTSDPGTGFYSLQVPAGIYDVTAAAAGHLPAAVADLVANDTETVQQDFNLTPEVACSVDLDFDDGNPGGWTNSGASTCSTGSFVVATPSEQVNGGVTTQVGGDHTSGSGNAFFSATNTSAGSNDVDGGTCIVESPVYAIASESDISIWYFHGQRDAGDDAGDFFLLEISTDGGSNWSPLASFGDVTVQAAWAEVTATVPAGSDVQFRVQVADAPGGGDLVEAGVDDLMICPNTPPCTVDADCDDTLFCNGTESCNAGTCQPGTPVACDDGVACTVDACDEGTDACGATPIDALCDNGTFCDGAETCDPINDCQAGSAVDCDDGVACTVDACNEGTDSCDNLPDSSPCQNGVFCDGAEICDPLLGCQAGGDPCPGETCDEAGDVCIECFTDGDCDDGAFCNGTETCVAGTCEAGSDPCPGQSCDEGGDICVDADPVLWMSFRSNTTVPGVGTVADEDIVSYDEGTGTWALEFDGSDVGLGGLEISGLAVLPSGDLLLSFTAAGTVGGLSVDDSDIVQFTPTSLGTTTAGTFSLYFDGSDVAMTSNSEDVDGIALAADGRLIVSTTGSFSGSGASGADEDLFLFTGTLGAATSGSFAQHFDGSDVGLGGNSAEDVDAAALTETGELLFSTIGDFAVTGASGADEDVVEFSGTFGASTSGSFVMRLDLSTLGIATGEDIGSLHILE